MLDKSGVFSIWPMMMDESMNEEELQEEGGRQLEAEAVLINKPPGTRHIEDQG